MSLQYDELQDSGEPRQLGTSAVQLAGDVTPVKPEKPLEDVFKDAYSREIRRSPGDGTFRQPSQWNKDWDAFKAPLSRVK